jgi:hypothetical protein
MIDSYIIAFHMYRRVYCTLYCMGWMDGRCLGMFLRHRCLLKSDLVLPLFKNGWLGLCLSPVLGQRTSPTICFRALPQPGLVFGWCKPVLRIESEQNWSESKSSELTRQSYPSTRVYTRLQW